MKRLKLTSLLLASWLSAAQLFAQQAVNIQDSLALVDLYDSTNGPNWSNNSGWKKGPVSTWYGVTVTEDRVTLLYLSSNNLTGSLPESIGNLTGLDNLDLTSNQLRFLPESIGNLTNLHYLQLIANQFSSLPESIGNLTGLQYLDLSDNQFRSLPESFGNLKSLGSLSLGYNQLSSLPESIGKLTGLQHLDLIINHLSSLPASFGNLKGLQFLDLTGNQFSSLPGSIGNLTNLQILQINGNQFSSLPESIGNLTGLQELSLSGNQLSSIPASFGNLVNLQRLSLDFNQLSSLPESIGNLTGLQHLDLSNNKFTFSTLEGFVQHQNSVDFNYAPQDTIELIKRGNTLIAPVGGTPKNNSFYWYRDDTLEKIFKSDSTYSPLRKGHYRMEAHNVIASKLTLYSDAVDFVPDCDVCIFVWYRDADGDGWGNPNSTKEAAGQPKGYVSNNLDCDDKNKVKGGPEVCDGIDNDCDGIIDDGLTETTFYSDFDGDGYGSNKRTITTCAPPPRYIAVAGDCNDDNATVYPGAPELCDGRDNDCNGKIDDGLTQKPFYWDGDKDGYGFRRPVYACAAPPGYISTGGDFNDNDTSIHPGAVEHCDGVDEDCDGVIDNGFVQKRFYKDQDGDGWGSNSNLMAGCAPKGYVERKGDCNDHDASIHPEAAEVPNNGIDDNCNGQVDEVITTAVTLYGMTTGALPDDGPFSLGVLFSFTPATHNYIIWRDLDRASGANFHFYETGSLMKAMDGTLYGTTNKGGANEEGVLFSFDPNTAIYTKLYDFGSVGARPNGRLVQAANGKLYGTTNYGAATIFSFDPVTRVGKNESTFPSDVSHPLGGLVQASDGKLYGMAVLLAAEGNSENKAILYAFDPVHATYTNVFDFYAPNDPEIYPYGDLAKAADGKLYGITISISNAALLFAIDPATQKITPLDSFYSSDGYGPRTLMQASNGVLYGTTPTRVFSFNPTTAKLTKLFELGGANGTTPYGALIQASDGKLYGTTRFDGAHGGGTLFSLDPATASVTKMWDFPEDVKGGAPVGLLIEYNPVCKQITYYQDKDGDGYGTNKVSVSVASCKQPKGYVVTAGDCDDGNANRYPGADDSNCDGIDDNCDGVADDRGYCEGVITKTGKVSIPSNVTALQLSAAPNPAANYFNVHINGTSGKRI